jgi:hypothetical protein
MSLPAWTEEKVKLPNTPKQVRIAERRREALRLRAEEGLTFAEIANRIMAQKHKYVDEGQSYEQTQAYRDVQQGLKAISGDLRELAKLYLPGELAKVEATEIRMEQAEKEVFDLFMQTMTSGSYVDFQDLQRITDSLTKIVDRRIKLQERRARMIPLEVPKRFQMQSETINYSLDDYLAIQKRAKDDRNAIEGDFIVKVNGEQDKALSTEVPDSDS